MDISPEMVVAIGGAVAAILTPLVALVVSLRRKLDQVHVLVNSKMTSALTEIVDLKKEIADLKTKSRE